MAVQQTKVSFAAEWVRSQIHDSAATCQWGQHL